MSQDEIAVSPFTYALATDLSVPSTQSGLLQTPSTSESETIPDPPFTVCAPRALAHTPFAPGPGRVKAFVVLGRQNMQKRSVGRPPNPGGLAAAFFCCERRETAAILPEALGSSAAVRPVCSREY
ncbi:hypothetical protein GWI33_002889 [Rhynchophorus ferrugineus]|uniref:Uncharacterized protein n=1 Tax=Rhynchophorus ferrugineus TaxID=354439 RepID=A0A834MJD6_RHYFE|nr:hypothetical protein GWI33_002889 [Rhynchophorus ferrugineus]